MLTRIHSVSKHVCGSNWLFNAVVALFIINAFFLLKAANVIVFNSQPTTGPSMTSTEYAINNPGCKIPFIHPFHHTVTPLLRTYSPIHCFNITPPLTYVDEEYLRINRTVLFLHYKDFSYCQYQEIKRADPSEVPNPDDVFQVAKHNIKFDRDKRMTVPFVRLACYNRYHDLIYTNAHAFIIPVLKTYPYHNPEESSFNSIGSRRFNVIMIGLDSVSHTNFIRQMPKTRSYIVENLGAAEMWGYNKVGDNTLVNLIPMLTGKFIENIDWADQGGNQPFDDVEIIWKHFSDFAYYTLLAEDAPEIAIFNFMKYGFKSPPTDFYLRPFSLAMEDHGSLWTSNHDCFGGKLETQIVLDYTCDFVKLHHRLNQSYFAYTFITRLSHEDLNKLQVADSIYYEFFKDLSKQGILDDSFVFLYSDHGIRFGSIRLTHSGKLEERLPLLVIIPPKTFRKHFPDQHKQLFTNQRRLLTPFDIYATLMDILPSPDTQWSSGSLGHSVFGEMSNQRSCSDAGIEPHWCSCYQPLVANTRNPTIARAALFTVKSINDYLAPVDEYCEEFTLHDIVDALYLNSPQQPGGEDGYTSPTDYLITIIAAPGEAAFEASVRYNAVTDEFTLLGDISRINAYGHQPVCIQQHRLLKFCLCRHE